MLQGKRWQPYHIMSILQYGVAKRSSISLTVLKILSGELRGLSMEEIWRHQELYFGFKILQSYILHTVMNTWWRHIAKMLTFWIATNGDREIHNDRGETLLHPVLTGLFVLFRACFWTGFNRLKMSSITLMENHLNMFPNLDWTCFDR